MHNKYVGSFLISMLLVVSCSRSTRRIQHYVGTHLASSSVIVTSFSDTDASDLLVDCETPRPL
jgi:hypothetical protein